MKRIILLGTNHSIQRGEIRNPEFGYYIENIISNYKPQTIAEEIDKISVAAKIASSGGVKYSIIEPTIEERKALRILSISEIEFSIFMEFDDQMSVEAQAELTKRKESVYRAREQEWLNRLTSINDWPVLVICGANHFDPFCKLLQKNGHEVVRECKDWE